MTNQELYHLILKRARDGHRRPSKVILKDITSLCNRSGSELMDVVCDLVNRRMEIRKDDLDKSIPIFQQVKLKESGFEEMELEVIFDDEVVPLLEQ